jgi:NAD(P)-dependent dehydrogenase (short-subunit alcohol dehydrogenase family)
VLREQDRPLDETTMTAEPLRARGGRDAAAYSSAKVAELHLVRCLAEEGGAARIRVNTVKCDAVLQGSRIWDSSWPEERTSFYGIAPDELEALPVAHDDEGEILPTSLSRRALASPARSGKGTDNVLNMDGGVPAKYPR